MIALAHTLELEYEGTKHIESINDKNNKIQAVNKAQSVFNGQGIKKSKTGRTHSKITVPLKDTGVRLSMLKKVIPFHFDEFMTFSKQKCM